MVTRIALVALLLLATGAAHAFENLGTVPLSSGGRATVVAVTDLNATTQSGRLLIQGKNSLGQTMRVFKSTSINAGKLRTYAATCLRVPAGCAAAVALAGIVSYYGWTVLTGTIQREGYSSTCPSSYTTGVPDANGNPQAAWIGLPCLQTTPTLQIYHTLNPSEASAEWATQEPTVASRWVALSPAGPAIYEEVWVYRRGLTQLVAADPMEGELEDVPIEELIEAGVVNPELLQPEPGLWADIWEPVAISEMATEEDYETGVITNPLPEPGAGESGNGTDNPVYDPTQDPEYQGDEDLMTMDDIDSDVIDLSGYLDWGSGWLPRTCPAPVMIAGSQFSYEPACQIFVSYLAPMVRISALIAFLLILFRGFQ